MEWIGAICRGIHVLAAVCWIGALYFLVRAVRPILLQGNDEQNYDRLRDIQKKFRVLAGMMLLTVLVTGIGNIIFDFYNFHGFTPPMNWMMILGIKLMLVAVLFIIYFINLSTASRNQKKMTENPDLAKQAPGFVLSKTALVIGFIIIFLGVILHTGVIR